MQSLELGRIGQLSGPQKRTAVPSGSLYSDELRRTLPSDCFFASNSIFQRSFLSACAPLVKGQPFSREWDSTSTSSQRQEIRPTSCGPLQSHQSASYDAASEAQILKASAATPFVCGSDGVQCADRPVGACAAACSEHLPKKPKALQFETTGINLLCPGGPDTAKPNTSSPDVRDKASRASTRIMWTPEMNDLFVRAYNSIVGEVPTPVRILRYMGPHYPMLTQKQVQSKLQKYRLRNKARTLSHQQVAVQVDGPALTAHDIEVSSVTPSPTFTQGGATQSADSSMPSSATSSTVSSIAISPKSQACLVPPDVRDALHVTQ